METQHNDSPAETRLDVSQSRQSQSPRMTEQSPVLQKITRQACDYASVKVIECPNPKQRIRKQRNRPSTAMERSHTDASETFAMP
mgnify:CR=1 FL=1